MSRDTKGKDSEKHCFPRVSGDEPHCSAKLITFNQFSPRERG